MLKRKATDFIKKWIDAKNKKCLVVQGARQTGKTYIIERFAEENFLVKAAYCRKYFGRKLQRRHI